MRFEEPRKTLVRIGYRKPSVPEDDPVLAVVREEAVRAAGLVEPLAAWAVIDPPADRTPEIFAGACRVAFAVSTIGPRLERASAALFAAGEDLRGMALDALGSEAVAQVSKQMDRFLAEKGRQMGLWPSKRYAPGYRGWDVCEQAFLFSVIPAAEIGVALTESFMMVPRKSYSFRLNYYADQALSTRRFPLPER